MDCLYNRMNQKLKASIGCGVEMDRDVHASQNMVWFYKNNVGVGRTDVKRVEMESLVLEVINNQRNQILSKKHEAYTL